MTIFRLTGHITVDGKLEVELPQGLPAGEVKLTVEVDMEESPQTENDWEKQPWTDEELKELLTIKPMTGHEIVAAGLVGGWEDLEITDSVEWVEEQRRK
jgi:hypothetical protein